MSLSGGKNDRNFIDGQTLLRLYIDYDILIESQPLLSQFLSVEMGQYWFLRTNYVIYS